MKRTIIIALLSMAVMFSQAQTSATVMLASNGLAIDTVSNTGTETWTLKVPGPQKVISVQWVATKINGTVGGSVVFQGSINGTNWDTVLLVPAHSPTDVATQSKIFTHDDSKYLYYRVQWTGAGTMSASARCWLLARN